MQDELYPDKPEDWLNLMFTSIEKEMTMEIEAYSKMYKKLINQIEDTYKENPKLYDIMENNECNGHNELTVGDIRSLLELVDANMQLLQLYQRILFFKGCRFYSRMISYSGNGNN